jgi:hypothetical protein
MRDQQIIHQFFDLVEVQFRARVRVEHCSVVNMFAILVQKCAHHKFLHIYVSAHQGDQLWRYLRANKLAITVFDSYEDILDKCADAWNFFANDPGRITSITDRDWIKVKS